MGEPGLPAVRENPTREADRLLSCARSLAGDSRGALAVETGEVFIIMIIKCVFIVESCCPV